MAARKSKQTEETSDDSRCPTLRPNDVGLRQKTTGEKGLLDKILMEILNDLEPTENEFKVRRKVVHEILQYLKRTFPDAVLHVFGSTANGFCFHNSDIDVSLKLKSGQQRVKMPSEIVGDVSHVAELLSENTDYVGIRPILAVRVPIVKFTHHRSNLAIDLSMYNSEGIHTTKLLHTYSQIDERLKILAYTVKVMVKLCEFDGYRGYFAVSTYIYLLIHFCQQRSPPVLPVLHELYQGEKPELEEGDMDIYYYSDIPNLHRYWPEYGKNTEGAGELWLAFLHFYTQCYDPFSYIISIRQKALLHNSRDTYRDRYIAHQNPIQVGAQRPGLDYLYYKDVMNMFENAYETFQNLEKMPDSYSSYKDYALDPALLTKSRE